MIEFERYWPETTPWLFYNKSGSSSSNSDDAVLQDTAIQFARYPQPKSLVTQSEERIVIRSHMCQGPTYDALAYQLHKYSRQTELHGPTWGRRRPLRIQQQQQENDEDGDADASVHQGSVTPHTRILAFGNSHTRQVTLAWMVQQMPYGIQHTELLYTRYAMRFDLTDINSTVYLVTNSYAPYANNWPRALSNLTDGLTLADFDVVIVGNVNGCLPTTPEKPGSLDKFVQAGIPDLNCDRIPPTYEEWMDSYFTSRNNNTIARSSRLLFLSSFMKGQLKKDRAWARWVDQVRRDHPQGNQVGFIYGRHHIDAVGNEGSDFRNATEQQPGDADCPSCSSSGHKCVGRYGGHPDLVAFDVAEWLWTGMDSFNHSYTPRPFIQDLYR